MSIRKSIRRTLSSVDRQLGLRDWLREGGNGDAPQAAAASDPFAVSEFPHPRPNTVLDIGGSHGQFALEIFKAFPEATVYSFEPIPECYAELSALAAARPTLHPMEVALSDHEGTQELRLSRFRDSSSLQEMLPAHLDAWPHTEIERNITVRLARLDAVAQGLSLKPPILAKMDVQGHEMSVIRGGRETLRKCQRVMTECNFAPLYAGQPSFTELYEELRTLGFRFEGFISLLRHPVTLELLSADAIFYKTAD